MSSERTAAPANGGPLSADAYRRALEGSLAADPFAPDASAVFHLVAHFAFALALNLFVAFRGSRLSWVAIPFLAFVAGHSAFVTSIASHEVAHGAGRIPRRLRAILAHLGWTFSIFGTPTLQAQAHNRLHHKLENSPRDPDRRLCLEEIRRGGIDGVAAFLVPNGRHPVLTAPFGFMFSVMSYHLGLFWHTVLRSGEIYDVRLDARKRRRVVIEACSNGAFVVSLVALSGPSWKMVAFLAMQYWVGATIAGLYIATNHLLCGMSSEAMRDPVASSVSLRVPAWVDALHIHFSHHAEHHLYAGAGHRVLPAVRVALRDRFPDRYREMSWPRALRVLLSMPLAIVDNNAVADPDGRGRTTIPFPSYDVGPFVPPLPERLKGRSP